MTYLIDSLIATAATASLTDVSVAGFIRNTLGGWQFHHRLVDIFLHFTDGTILQCSSIDQYDKLRLQTVDRVTFNFELGEDEEYAISSIAKLCLRSPQEPRYVVSMYLVISETTSINDGVVKCAAFELEQDDFLFLDPITLSGIQIGKREAYESWLREFGGRGDGLTELVWRHGDQSPRPGRTFEERP
jgi:hypothetical protein